MRHVRFIGVILLLAGCVPPDEDSEFAKAFHRAQVVRTCSNGTTMVGRDPVTKRLLWGSYFSSGGYIPEGVTPEQFCR